ncbi:MAG: DUF4423 domain-containing protein [Bdellovibrio sp.]
MEPNKTKISLHYSDLLFSELKRRINKNKKYSLRSFARDLDISPSFMSRILRKETSLSLKKGEILLKKIKWSEVKSELFILLINYHNCSGGTAKQVLESQLVEKIKKSEQEIFNLNREHHFLLSQWFHFAIIELTLLPSFKSSPRWIAERLKITVPEVEESIKRMLLLGILQYDGNILKRCHSSYWIGNYSSKDIRAFHANHLSLAAKALEKQKMEERYFIGSTFPVDVSSLPKIESLIKEFHKKILAISESANSNQIYHMAVQLYRLDEIGN